MYTMIHLGHFFIFINWFSFPFPTKVLEKLKFIELQNSVTV